MEKEIEKIKQEITTNFQKRMGEDCFRDNPLKEKKNLTFLAKLIYQARKEGLSIREAKSMFGYEIVDFIIDEYKF